MDKTDAQWAEKHRAIRARCTIPPFVPITCRSAGPLRGAGPLTQCHSATPKEGPAKIVYENLIGILLVTLAELTFIHNY